MDSVGLLSGASYILGAGIYAARVPRRLMPGDSISLRSSHQIFHVLVVCAAVAHLTGAARGPIIGTVGLPGRVQIPRGWVEEGEVWRSWGWTAFS